MQASGYASDEPYQLPSNIIWNDVTYGAGYYVAVGNNTATGQPNIAYSTDGVSWTLGATLPQGNWNSIAYGNGTFVVGSNNIDGRYDNSTDVMTSNWVYLFSTTDPTSLDWIPCAIGFSELNSQIKTSGMKISQIIYALNKFFAVGTVPLQDSNTLFSDDGLNWYFIKSKPMSSIIFVPSSGEILGLSTTDEVKVSSIYFLDMTNLAWKKGGTVSNGNIENTKMYYNSDTRRLTTENNYYSDDGGHSWNIPDDTSYVSDIVETESDALSVMTVACNPEGTVVKVGKDTIKYLIKNLEYMVTSISTADIAWYHVTYVNNMFFAFGTSSDGTKTAYSSDGQTWNTYPPQKPGKPTGPIVIQSIRPLASPPTVSSAPPVSNGSKSMGSLAPNQSSTTAPKAAPASTTGPKAAPASSAPAPSASASSASASTTVPKAAPTAAPAPSAPKAAPAPLAPKATPAPSAPKAAPAPLAPKAAPAPLAPKATPAPSAPKAAPAPLAPKAAPAPLAPKAAPAPLAPKAAPAPAPSVPKPNGGKSNTGLKTNPKTLQ